MKQCISIGHFLPFARAKGSEKHAGKRCTAVYRSERSEASIRLHCYCERCYGSLIINDDKLAALFVI